MAPSAGDRDHTEDRDFTVEEVADVMRVSAQTVRLWIKKGWVNAHKTPSGRWRVSQAEVDRLRGRDGVRPDPGESDHGE